MRPRVLTRGNRRSPGRLRSSRSSFNEASRSHARKRVGPERGPLLVGRASMRPRVLTRGNAACAQHCGACRPASMRPRVLTRGNLHLPVRRAQRLVPASMRPRVLTRGNTTPRTRSIWSPRRFNEASRSHARKRVAHVAHPVQGVASMRPRVLTRGNRPSTPRPRTRRTGFNEASRSHARKRYAHVSHASRVRSFNEASRSHARKLS